jgi:hypothetical protein
MLDQTKPLLNVSEERKREGGKERGREREVGLRAGREEE